MHRVRESPFGLIDLFSGQVVPGPLPPDLDLRPGVLELLEEALGVLPRHHVIQLSGAYEDSDAREIGQGFGLERHHGTEQDRTAQEMGTREQQARGDLGTVGETHREELAQL